MHGSNSKPPHVLMVGGGHGHAVILRDWLKAGKSPARLTLVNPDRIVVYSGMMPGVVSGAYEPCDAEIDLQNLCARSDVRFVQDEVVSIDVNAKHAVLKQAGAVPFDYLSLDVGSCLASEPYDDQLVPVKPLGAFLQRWHSFLSFAEQGLVPPSVCMIGGGPAGIEMALAIAARLNLVCSKPAQVHLIQRADKLVPHLREKQRKILLKRAEKAGIKICVGVEAKTISGQTVTLMDGRKIEASFIVKANGPAPWPWIGETALELENGFVRVGPTLQSVSHPYVFAIGDCAHMVHAPRPKAGAYAIAAAPIASENLQALIKHNAPKSRYQPNSDFIKLIFLSRNNALAAHKWATFSGGLVWDLKDWIDRSYVDGLNGV